RGRPRRRADRRPRGAPRLEPERPVQDDSRRPHAAPRTCRGRRAPGGGVMADPVIVRLLGTGEAAVDCDECFDLLDRYVEAELAREPVDELFPGMRAHLTGCPACEE